MGDKLKKVFILVAVLLLFKGPVFVFSEEYEDYQDFSFEEETYEEETMEDDIVEEAIEEEIEEFEEEDTEEVTEDGTIEEEITEDDIAVEETFQEIQPFPPQVGSDKREDQPKYAHGQLIVKFKEEPAKQIENLSVQSRTLSITKTYVSSFDTLNQKYGVTKIEPVFKSIHQNLKRGIGKTTQTRNVQFSYSQRALRAPKDAKVPDLSSIYLLTFPKEIDVIKAAAEYQADPNVEYAEPNYIYEIFMYPNDPYYSSSGSWGQSYDDLWGLKKIQCEQAWDITQGEGVVVAVIDTGIDYNHEDIAQNIWINQDEIPNNGIDDDSNGFIDDVKGWDFAYLDNDPADRYGHGTHCAGTIAGVGNNNIGIIGVAPLAKVMAVKGLSDGGAGFTPNLANCIYYAVENGADILSNSWGGKGDSQTLEEAFQYAYSMGVVSIAAAGNDNRNVEDFLPAKFPTVITVSAFDQNDEKCYFSNWGEKIDVAAPGGGENRDNVYNILSCLANGSYLQVDKPHLIVGKDYMRLGGTSMACPHVAGVAALILSHQPMFTNQDIRFVLRASADDVDLPGFDINSGFGRINANNAVQINDVPINPPEPPIIPVPINHPPDLNPIGNKTIDEGTLLEFTVSATDPDGDRDTLTYSASGSPTGATFNTSTKTFSWTPTSTQSGSYQVTFKVSDIRGSTDSETITITVNEVGNSEIFPLQNNGLFHIGEIVIIIKGAATSSFFSHYILDYGRGKTPDNWSVISYSETPVQNGVLGRWNLTGPSPSLYTLRLRVFDRQGKFVEDRKYAVLDNFQEGWPQGPFLINGGLKFADLDADGDMEIVLAGPYGCSPAEYCIYIFNHRGELLSGWPKFISNFYDPENFLIEDSSFIPIIGDIDGDGDQEIVFAGFSVWPNDLRGDIYIHAYHHNGEPVSGWPVIFNYVPGCGDGFGLSLVDIDGDAALEIIGVWTQFGMQEIHIFNGNGSEISSFDFLKGIGRKTLFAIADVDGDSNVEIVLATNMEVHLFRLDGTEMQGWPKILPDPNPKSVWDIAAPTLGDLDKDGEIEIVYISLSKSSLPQVQVWDIYGQNKPGWPVYVGQQVTEEPLSSNILLGDIDGDGFLEIIFSILGFTPEVRLQFSTYVLNHNGTNLSPWPKHWGDEYWCNFKAIADVDNDNKMEIVGTDNFNNLCAYKDNGTVPNGWPKPSPPQYDRGSSLFPVAIGDIDNDGELELGISSGPMRESILCIYDLETSNRVQPEWQLRKHDNQHTGFYNHEPILDEISDKIISPGELFSFYISATDQDQNDTLKYYAAGLPQDATLDRTTGEFSWRPPNYSQTYPVCFMVTDGILWDRQMVMIEVQQSIVNHPPILNTIGNKTIDEGKLLSFTISATDPDGDALTYSIVDFPEGYTFNNQTFSWTPNYEQGGRTYNVTFIVSDGSLTDSETITITVNNVIQDTQAPSVPTGLKATAVSNSQIDLSWSASTDNVGVAGYRVYRGGVKVAEISSISYQDKGLAVNTTYSYQVSSYDTAGNESAKSTSVSATTLPVSNNPPVLAPIGNKTIDEGKLLEFTVTATDPENDLLFYSAEGLPEGAKFYPQGRMLGSPYVFKWIPDHSQAGDYQVTFTATDGYYLPDSETITINLTDSETITITVNNVIQDTQAPSVPTGLKATAVSNSQIDLSWSASTDNVGVAGYRVYRGGVKVVEIGSISYQDKGLAVNTTYSYQVSSYDTAGNESAKSTSVSATTLPVSNNPPVLNPIGNKTVNEGDILGFRVTATDPDGDTLTYSAQPLPQDARFIIEQQWFFWIPSDIQAGKYSVTFKVSDGKLTDSETITITVNDAPVNRPPVLNPIGNQTLHEGVSSARLVKAIDPDGDTLTYSAENLPAGATFDNENEFHAWYFSWRPTYEQRGRTYEVTFIVSDGKLTDSETITITVTMNRPPVLNPIGNKTIDEGKLLSFTVSATDPDGGSLRYCANSYRYGDPGPLPNGATFTNQTFSWRPSYTQGGKIYWVTFKVFDEVLIDSETITITVNDVPVVNNPPVLDSIGNKTIDGGQLLQFTISATDPDGDTLTYSATVPTGATFNTSTKTFSWALGYGDAGSYKVTFNVSDGELIDSEIITIIVNNVNRPPVLDSIGNKSVDENQLLEFTISATDPDTDNTLNYSAQNLPSGATFTGQTFSWKPTYTQAGIYSVTFRVTDGQLSNSETITITVNNVVNRAPVLNPIGNKTIDEGKLLTFTVTAFDPDGDALIYSAENLPQGATLAGQTFSWKPTYTQNGLHYVTFKVSDGKLSDSETITIAVYDVNRAPVLDPIISKVVNEGQLLEFTVTATDPDGDSLVYSAENLPGGATFTGQTFSWTAGYSQATPIDWPHQVIFEVSDGRLTDAQSMVIHVQNVNFSPVLNPIGNKTVNEGDLLTFTISGLDNDPDNTLNLSAENVPLGASFNDLGGNITSPISGVFSWRPSYSQSGVYNITFTLEDSQNATASETITIAVSHVNRPPVFIQPDFDNFEARNIYVEPGIPVQFTVGAYDPDSDIGDQVELNVLNLPEGATFEILNVLPTTYASGQFIWTPTSDDINKFYEISFIVTDTSGASDKGTMAISVEEKVEEETPPAEEEPVTEEEPSVEEEPAEEETPPSEEDEEEIIEEEYIEEDEDYQDFSFEEEITEDDIGQEAEEE